MKEEEVAVVGTAEAVTGQEARADMIDNLPTPPTSFDGVVLTHCSHGFEAWPVDLVHLIVVIAAG